MADILIVDDEEADRLQIAAALQPAGHKLFFAENGIDALTLFIEHEIHAVVTDIMMPGGSGLTLISELKTIKPSVPVIAISGKGPGGLSVASAMGAEDVIIKPFAPGHLSRTLWEALKESQGR